jgi:hypothetical protein
VYSNLSTDSNKFLHYYILYHISPRPGSLSLTPHSTGPKACTPYQLPYVLYRQKYYKLRKVIQVILPVIGGAVVLSASFRYLTAMSTASNAVTMAVATWCTDITLSSITAILTYMSVSNPLLRSPAQTHVLSFNNLPYL